ncbi:CopG family transcriptional regulator [Allostella sp. ATCC 35155]|nr:CopG family transcriptional regulator [Stella sp. ATCC 35155]
MKRRELLLAAGAALLPANLAAASPAKTLTVFKDPACGCCDGWVAHMRQAGFRVTVAAGDVYAAKERLGVPEDLASCHTATVDGYVIEGHAPADAVRRLLAERPAATGLAVPGMPAGSPGMEGGAPETYDVVVFGPRSRATFGRYRETRAV